MLPFHRSKRAELRAKALPPAAGESPDERQVWTFPEEDLPALEAAGQIVLRYEEGANPNGSLADVAGVASPEGNVMGLMPHPEHAVDPLIGSPDGCLILGSLVDAARARMAVAA